MQTEAITQLCMECGGSGGIDYVFDLGKTDWVELDIPVVIEASLMKIF